MVLRRRQLAAGVAALSLLTGCGLFGGRNSGLQGQVEMMGAQTGAQLLSGLIFTPNPDETAVQFRLPGEDYWMGATRFATWPGDEPPQPRSGRAFDQVPYEALQTQLAELEAQCSDSPRVVAFVAPSGAMISESHCGTEASETVLATWVNGAQLGTPTLDMTTADGYNIAFREIEAALPPVNIFQLSVPGLGAPDDERSLVVQGAPWWLVDQTECMVRYTRWLEPEPGRPLRSYDCDGLGLQSTDTDQQQEIMLAETSASDIQALIAEAQDASGFAPEQVSRYLVMSLLLGGMTVAVQTVDGQQYEYRSGY